MDIEPKYGPLESTDVKGVDNAFRGQLEGDARPYWARVGSTSLGKTKHFVRTHLVWEVLFAASVAAVAYGLGWRDPKDAWRDALTGFIAFVMIGAGYFILVFFREPAKIDLSLKELLQPLHSHSQWQSGQMEYFRDMYLKTLHNLGETEELLRNAIAARDSDIKSAVDAAHEGFRPYLCNLEIASKRVTKLEAELANRYPRIRVLFHELILGRSGGSVIGIIKVTISNWGADTTLRNRKVILKTDAGEREAEEILGGEILEWLSNSGFIDPELSERYIFRDSTPVSIWLAFRIRNCPIAQSEEDAYVGILGSALFVSVRDSKDTDWRQSYTLNSNDPIEEYDQPDVHHVDAVLHFPIRCVLLREFSDQELGTV